MMVLPTFSWACFWDIVLRSKSEGRVKTPLFMKQLGFSLRSLWVWVCCCGYLFTNSWKAVLQHEPRLACKLCTHTISLLSLKSRVHHQSRYGWRTLLPSSHSHVTLLSGWIWASPQIGKPHTGLCHDSEIFCLCCLTQIKGDIKK